MNDDDNRKALNLEYFTIVYNFLEALASLFFGSAAGSIALVGFGLDSVIESLSGGILVWRLRKEGLTGEEMERTEKRALFFISLTFVILGVYVLYESIVKLVTHEIATPSLPGIIIAVLSIIVMPVLAIKKRNLGNKIGSSALVADSKETMVCAFLSVALLAGLGANFLFGFWQADPLVGLIIAVFLFREGMEIWKESRE